ncbi:hypothetical protein SAMN04488012_105186 [Palleronia salina]|uniref:DUF2065 domain-containing protein n=2 Tax=Palleronia TaxID=315422 RepID=A0A1M6H2E7_9RHOB|nr:MULTISPECIES: DUF2065 domain-containing protein [Palleronia]SEN08154.1 hypothetical protein SAMN04488011_102389 [Palleronia pelagia]SHJ16373.1 hypothetical protein SAMN04488012_105186 [Palleronia salina]
MATILLAIGLVLIIEGLVFALAPSRLEDLLAALKQMPIETRRLVGFGALTLGVILVAWARSLGA